MGWLWACIILLSVGIVGNALHCLMLGKQIRELSRQINQQERLY